jgi:hypothetical protein
MKIACGVLGLAFAVGCGAPAADERAADVNTVNADANAQNARNDRETAHAMMKPVCRSGKPIGGHCGLIVKRAEMDDFRASFRDKKCAGITDDACQDLFESSIEGWLQERYKFANFEQVDKVCDASKDKCAAPSDREILLQQSHNDALGQVATATANKIEEEREAGLEQQEAPRLDVFVPPGTVVVVHAHRGFAYPAIIGGVHRR